MGRGYIRLFSRANRFDGLFDLVLDIGCLRVVDAATCQDQANGVIFYIW